MPSSVPATRDYQQAQVALRALTYKDVGQLWALLDPENLDATFPVFAAATLQIIQQRRDVSATFARKYIAALRVGVAGAAPIVSATPLPRSEALTSLRFASVVSIKTAMTRGTSLRLASRNALVRTMGVADKYIGDGGRELIRSSVAADPAARGWIRVTLGTCDYCAEQAAGDDLHEGESDFPRHDHCGCIPEPQYDDALTPEEDFVQKILGQLARGEVTEAQLRALLADAGTKPLSRVNISEALDRFTAQRAISPDAFLSRSQYDALAPNSAWSAEKRTEILAALRETPEGKILADTLERFQDGGSIARLRSRIDQYLAGVDIDATSKARVEALLNAIRHSPDDWAPSTLYRGMTVKGKLENVLAKYRVGEKLDLNLTSFSSDRSVATRFQSMTAKGGNETRVMVELIGPGKRVIPIQNLPGDRRLFREKEWVSAGRYEIVEVKRSGGAIILRIRQIGSP